jgi:hypothetical protein
VQEFELDEQERLERKAHARQIFRAACKNEDEFEAEEKAARAGVGTSVSPPADEENLSSAEKLAIINTQWLAAEEAATEQRLAAEEAANAQWLAAEEAANAPGYQKQLKREMRRRQYRSEMVTPSPPSSESRPSYNNASPMTRHAATAANIGPRRRALAFPPAPAASHLTEQRFSASASSETPVAESQGMVHQSLKAGPENTGAAPVIENEDCAMQ